MNKRKLHLSTVLTKKYADVYQSINFIDERVKKPLTSSQKQTQITLYNKTDTIIKTTMSSAKIYTNHF